jgi:Holliday junction resolvasome RuvABC endonuclease subunit
MGDFTTLALDLGSTTGWCLANNGVIIDSGEVTLSSGKDAHPGHRWLRFQNWLFQFHQVDEILFEDVMFMAKNGVLAMRVYGALLGILQIFALAHKKRMASLTPGQVKKDFTGSGVAKKNEICQVATNLGWKNGREGTDTNNNEADAIALYWVISSRRGVQPSFLHQNPKLMQVDIVIDEYKAQDVS